MGPTIRKPHFAIFTEIVCAQTTILFIETVIVIAIWNSEKTVRCCLKCRTDSYHISDQGEAKLQVSYKKAALRVDTFFFVGNLIVSTVSVLKTSLGIQSFF